MAKHPSRVKDCPDLVRARVRWKEGRTDEALRLFDKALRRQPNNPLALADAARAFGARFEPAKASTILARLEKLAAGRPGTLVLAAQSYRMSQRPLEAIRCLERALTKHPDHAEANFELSILLERCNQLERARECIARFQHAEPESAEGKLVNARILVRLGGGRDPHQALAELAEPGLHPLIRAEALSLAAGLHDREGDYEKAFDTMLAGKEVLQRISSGAKREAEALEPELLQMQEGVTAAHLERWSAVQEDPDECAMPLTLMTGPPRSGSTLLMRILDSHPALAISDEVGALSEEILPAALRGESEQIPKLSADLIDALEEASRVRQSLRYRRILLEYLGAQPGSAQPEMLIDKCPSVTPLIPGFLRLIPSGRLIVPLRDPRDIVISSLFCHLPINRISVAFLNPADAVRRVAFELDSWIRLRAILDEERAIEVRYERVIKDFAQEARRVFAHLGVSADEPVENYLTAGSQRPVNSPTYIQATQPIHQRSIARWKHYQKHLEPHLEALEPSTQALGYG